MIAIQTSKLEKAIEMSNRIRTQLARQEKRIRNLRLKELLANDPQYIELDSKFRKSRDVLHRHRLNTSRARFSLGIRKQAIAKIEARIANDMKIEEKLAWEVNSAQTVLENIKQTIMHQAKAEMARQNLNQS